MLRKMRALESVNLSRWVIPGPDNENWYTPSVESQAAWGPVSFRMPARLHQQKHHEQGAIAVKDDGCAVPGDARLTYHSWCSLTRMKDQTGILP